MSNSQLIGELNKGWDRLKSKRSEWLEDWRSIFEQILPYRPRWNLSDKNKATAKDTAIINSTPTRAMRTMCAGFMSSITSPSRIWFRLAATPPGLSEVPAVKGYLAECERVIRQALMRSRFYQQLAQAIYPDLSCIATSCMFEEPHRSGGVRFEEFPPGEYCLDVNSENDVDTCFREFRMSVRQLVQEFCTRDGAEPDLSALSVSAQDAYRRKQYDQEFDVRHAVYPRRDYQPGAIGPKGKAYASQWWQVGTEVRELLRDSGYEENPIIAPRWNARDGETYGRGSPGWECKSDCKALQRAERVKTKLFDKAADPPTVADESLRDGRVSLVPGAVSYGKRHGTGRLVEPVMEVQPGQMEASRGNVDDHEERVHAAFYSDLWLAMLRDERAQPRTAFEISERRNEISVQLGPMLQNLNTGLLEPSVTRTYYTLERAGWLPDPPEELMGESVTVEMISVLHQAQKMTGIAGIRELIANVMLLAQAGKVDAVEKLDADKIVDEVADMLGVRPELVLDEKKVTAVRTAKAEQQQAQQQGQAMLAATEGAKNLAGVEPQRLQDLAGMMAPVAGLGVGNGGAA